MKGVSEIIAIILILMIVVALAALAYTWFSGIFSSLTTTTGNATSTTASAMSTNFRIEYAKNITGTSANNVSVTIRCLGTTTLDLTQLSVYISDVPATIVNKASLGTINYGNVSTFYVTNSSVIPDPKGSRIRIVAATGLEQSATIT